MNILKTNYDNTKEWLDNGGDVNYISSDKIKRNALFSANYEKSELLIEYGIDVNHVDAMGENALFSSVRDYKKFKLLLDEGINCHLVNKCRKENILFLILYNKYLTEDEREELFYRAEKNGADINIINYYGESLLHYAFNHNIFKYLVSKGLDMNNISNFSNKPSVFFNQAENDASENLEYMFLNNVNLTENDLFEITKITNYDTQLQCIKYLEGSGININTLNDKGENILFHIISVAKGQMLNEETFNNLLKNIKYLLIKIDINHQNYNNENLIHKLKESTIDLIDGDFRAMLEDFLIVNNICLEQKSKSGLSAFKALSKGTQNKLIIDEVKKEKNLLKKLDNFNENKIETRRL